MSEVLSQSQIDALLSAARSGENIEPAEDTSKEKKYRKYDFRSPRKFTKDRLKMLDSIFENYSRNLNSRVNALMHTSCEISVESAEEQRYYEFSNALIEGDVVTLAYVKYGDVREDTPALLHAEYRAGYEDQRTARVADPQQGNSKIARLSGPLHGWKAGAQQETGVMECSRGSII